MATLNFYYRSSKKQAFLTSKLRFSFNSRNYVKTAKTNTKTSQEIWSNINAKRIKDAQIKAKVYDLKKELTDLEIYVLNAFDNETEKINVTHQNWLLDRINEFYGNQRTIPNNLLEYIDYYHEVRKAEIKDHTVKKLNGFKKKMIQFEKEHKKKFKLIDVNESFKNDFISHLNKLNYSKHYIKKQISILKQLCNHAKYNGVEISHQVDKLTYKTEKLPIIYLIFDELEKMENVKLSTENLKAARDWFIISAYTGQRISDFMRFTTDMIREDNEDEFLEFSQQKTNKLMTIPLHYKVKEIIAQNNGKFPKKLTHQKYNDYLKTVCKRAGINQLIKGRKNVNIGTKKSPVFRYKTDYYPKYELITSHDGRRSFASNFYGKIPTNYLIYITGHSTESIFLDYIGKSNKDKAHEISRMFKDLKV